MIAIFDSIAVYFIFVKMFFMEAKTKTKKTTKDTKPVKNGTSKKGSIALLVKAFEAARKESLDLSYIKQ